MVPREVMIPQVHLKHQYQVHSVIEAEVVARTPLK